MTGSLVSLIMLTLWKSAFFMGKGNQYSNAIEMICILWSDYGGGKNRPTVSIKNTIYSCSTHLLVYYLLTITYFCPPLYIDIFYSFLNIYLLLLVLQLSPISPSSPFLPTYTPQQVPCYSYSLYSSLPITAKGEIRAIKITQVRPSYVLLKSSFRNLRC